MASGTRGYSSYRGRGRKGKVLLAILLILIILASVGFIIAREHMTYDADGNLHFELPWAKKTEVPDQPLETPDVEIQEPERTTDAVPARGILLSTAPQTMEAWTEELTSAGDDITMAAMTVKDSTGRVWLPLSGAAVGAVVYDTVLDENWARVMERDSVTKAARFSCFHDPKAANADVDGMGLKNTGGYIFYDGNNSQWLNPGLAKARIYLTDMLREIVKQDYNEIILTDVSYPTVGKLDKIDFSQAEIAQDTAEEGRCYWLESFLREVRDALPENVTLSLELPAETIRTGYDGDAGQDLSELAPLVDRIYAETTEADAPSLEAAVKAASDTCGFVPELAEKPVGALKNWLLIPQP